MSKNGCDFISGVIDTAIQAFIQDTGESNNVKIVQPGASMRSTKKPYGRATRIISRKNISVTTGEMVFKESGSGFLREIVIIADLKINTMIELDGRQPFGSRSEWDDLSDITLYSDTIVARQVGSSYVLSLTKLYFMKGLSIYVWCSSFRGYISEVD